jgi:hypothetical protein
MKLKKLSAFLPRFLRKLGKHQSKPAPVITAHVLEVKSATVPQPEPPKPTRSQKMLDDVCAFLGRYLQCSPHQRTVLALWILHTYCFGAARSTPYLAIQSSRKLSGKTLCLRLLALLCANPALTSGYTASALVKRIHSSPGQVPTFLLDESPATLGSRCRSKNSRLRAILVSGFQPGIGYSNHSLECTIFSPKAFASTGDLPEPLADCSLPIILQSLSESSSTERFDLLRAREEAMPLIAALKTWSQKNLPALKSAPASKRSDFPPGLSPRVQDIVEPLLQLADAVSGDYPARIRQAIPALLSDQDNEQRAIRNQLLLDIRQCFEHHGWPDGLHTSALLAWLLALPSRPWDSDGPITARLLARLLRPCGISPRLVRRSSIARGYRKEDFVELWSCIPGTEQGHPAVKPPSSTGASQPAPAAVKKSEIPNKDAACNTVTDAEIDPRLKGILADPRNYYRHYPEDHQSKMAAYIDQHEWPVPADDQNHPIAVSHITLNGGYHAPLRAINQPPWDTNKPRPRNFPAKSPRYPITFTREERIQVAVARLHEITESRRTERR